jgi:hypothetical protein
MRRHEAYMSAVVDKSLFGKCAAEGQVFTPILIHVSDLHAKTFDTLAKLASTFVELLEGDFAALPAGSGDHCPAYLLRRSRPRRTSSG